PHHQPQHRPRIFLREDPRRTDGHRRRRRADAMAGTQTRRGKTPMKSGILHATLIAPQLPPVVEAYAAQLSMREHTRGSLAADDAAALDLPDLAGAPFVWLANSLGEPVLRVIEDPQAVISEPMFRHGWL